MYRMIRPLLTLEALDPDGKSSNLDLAFRTLTREEALECLYASQDHPNFHGKENNPDYVQAVL